MEVFSDQAIEEERRLLQAIKMRRGKLSALTRKKNDVIHMIKTNEDNGNVRKHVDSFNELLSNFMELQVTVQ